MTVELIAISDWRLPGCGIDCAPRRHDPHAHELYGFLLAVRTPPARVVRTGPLMIDLQTDRRVTIAGNVVDLTARQWSVLVFLAERIGRRCGSDEITAAVWGPEWVRPKTLQCPGGQVYRGDHRVLSTTMGRLRDRLGVARSLITSGGAWDSSYRLERVEPTHA